MDPSTPKQPEARLVVTSSRTAKRLIDARPAPWMILVCYAAAASWLQIIKVMQSTSVSLRGIADAVTVATPKRGGYLLAAPSILSSDTTVQQGSRGNLHPFQRS